MFLIFIICTLVLISILIYYCIPKKHVDSFENIEREELQFSIDNEIFNKIKQNPNIKELYKPYRNSTKYYLIDKIKYRIRENYISDKFIEIKSVEFKNMKLKLKIDDQYNLLEDISNIKSEILKKINIHHVLKYIKNNKPLFICTYNRYTYGISITDEKELRITIDDNITFNNNYNDVFKLNHYILELKLENLELKNTANLLEFIKKIIQVPTLHNSHSKFYLGYNTIYNSNKDYYDKKKILSNKDINTISSIYNTKSVKNAHSLIMNNYFNYSDINNVPFKINIIRHAYKKHNQYTIDSSGIKESLELVNFINNKCITSAVSCNPNMAYTNDKSMRPQNTISFASWFLNLPVYYFSSSDLSNDGLQAMGPSETVEHIFENKLKYYNFANQNLLIVWEHHNIQLLLLNLIYKLIIIGKIPLTSEYFNQNKYDKRNVFRYFKLQYNRNPKLLKDGTFGKTDYKYVPFWSTHNFTTTIEVNQHYNLHIYKYTDDNLYPNFMTFGMFQHYDNLDTLNKNIFEHGLPKEDEIYEPPSNKPWYDFPCLFSK